MKYSLIFWLIWIGLMLFLILSPKKWINLKKAIIIIMLVAFLAPIILPRQVFGKWNSISKLKGKSVAKILLEPSAPNWQVNLIGTVKTISNKEEIDSLINWLQNTDVYFPSHPSRIWETKMLIISSDQDTVEIKIEETENNGTDIYTSTNEWRKDQIGRYLQKITSYKLPVYSDRKTIKH
jgi:hypothetical protein